MKNKKINYVSFAAGIVMIVSSVLNYNINGDYISLGIFSFAGMGFISISMRDKEKPVKNIYPVIFFSLSVLFLIYWILASQFDIYI